MGLAPAEPVAPAFMAHYEEWLRKGWQGDMHYLENHLTLRSDPRLLLPGAQTVVSLAMSYNPGEGDTQKGIAWYAQGRDYHEVIRERLTLLTAHLSGEDTIPPLQGRSGGVTIPPLQGMSGEVTIPPLQGRSGGVTIPPLQGRLGEVTIPPLQGRSGGVTIPPLQGRLGGVTIPSPTGGGQEGALWRLCVDTAPIMEKYWAWRCGLGWIGRNTQLVIPNEGSAFFLAEILTTMQADHYDTPLFPTPYHAGCKDCRRCLDACPTGALSDEGIDARRCLSYLTIEHRGELPQEAAPHLHTHFYGCDCCLRSCPHLSHKATTVAEFQPSPQLLGMTREDWATLTPEQYRQLFRGSAVKRAKYEGLMRNIKAGQNTKEQ